MLNNNPNKGLQIADFIYMFFLSFLISIVVYSFRDESKTPYNFISGFIETFVFISIVVCLIYYFMKQNVHRNLSFLVQEHFLLWGGLLLIVLLAFYLITQIYKYRNNSTGFLVFVISIAVVVIALMISAVNTTLTTRYDLNRPNYQSMMFASRFGLKPKQRISKDALKFL